MADFLSYCDGKDDDKIRHLLEPYGLYEKLIKSIEAYGEACYNDGYHEAEFTIGDGCSHNPSY